MAVSLKSSSSRWAKSGEGQSWKQGSSVTARFLFLKYCNGLQQQQGSSAELNKKMGDGYSDNFFGFVEAQKVMRNPSPTLRLAARNINTKHAAVGRRTEYSP
ncbi:unnamed protein product [Prunus armeniaca]|uniref:Uncharacterized protein n=1 Tax=Prunus armeniaca TaxID=36596 RepID=A0A6J5V7H0_PRUAR|nr:unnamed protein product [Prunus armeniaca]